jgi:DNA repair protein RecO (recombination protein O)
MALTGFCPNLSCCSICKTELENIKKNNVVFDLKKGGLVCEKCAPASSGNMYLSKGTIKQLDWIASRDMSKACRIKFFGRALEEGLELMERFVPYHLGKEPKSLVFLRQIRRGIG